MEEHVPDPLLRIRGLKTHFLTDERTVKAVDGVDIDIPRGKTVCVVGESGSGKSVTARSIMQLIDHPGKIVDGTIQLRPEAGSNEVIELTTLGRKDPWLRRIRGGDIGMIFQEPLASLSPMYTVGAQLSEAIRIHTNATKTQARQRGIQLLQDVGIPQPEQRFDSYPFQLSGGMCQRAMIAIALSCSPKLLIADEPTTALDVTTQARILELLSDIQTDSDMSMMFITHDMGVVAEMADEVTVMYLGNVVEHGTVEQIFDAPKHPYTKKLLDAVRNPLHHTHPTPATTHPRHTPEPDEADEADEPAPIMQLTGLAKHFTLKKSTFSRTKETIRAVDGIDLDIRAGETLGLVGESGCGKSTLGRTIARLLDPTAGTIQYTQTNGDVVNVNTINKHDLKKYRRDVRVVYQDPYSSLNPRMTLEQVVGEPLRNNKLATGKELRDKVADMLEKVGLKPEYLKRYPHAFSGGERQRISIARALITNPRLVIADEAVSALDASIRAQILTLLADLQQQFDLTYLFISHDLSVVERTADRVAVMYFGNIVEQGPTRQLYDNPQHEYTKTLLEAVPIPDPTQRKIHKKHPQKT